MSSNRNRNRNRANSSSDDSDEKNEVATGAKAGESTLATKEVLYSGDVSGEASIEEPARTLPIFATSNAPSGNPVQVKLFGQLVSEYVKGNFVLQMDQAKAKQVTGGLCTGFINLGKLNSDDVKKCLILLNNAIVPDTTAFDEGVMYRYSSTLPRFRLYIDMINLAKRYKSLGKDSSNITKVVDVEAVAKHYTTTVVQSAIISFYS